MDIILVTKIILAFILLLVITTPMILLSLGKLSDRRAENAGKKEIERLGYQYLGHHISNRYYGMFFKVNDKKYYVKYVYTFLKGPLEWIDGSPQEVLEQTSLKKDS